MALPTGHTIFSIKFLVIARWLQFFEEYGNLLGLSNNQLGRILGLRLEDRLVIINRSALRRR